jgi:2-oxoglutarate dehydrogenase E2 component (dihydrolipoamide succinyltransferase)
VEATILSWLKKPGDTIELEESMVEVATDKVDTEIPSTHAGVLKEILVKEGVVVKVGDPIAVLESDVEATDDAEPKNKRPKISTNVGGTESTPTNGHNHEAIDFKESGKFYSPLVKNIAKEENISLAELDSIAGSGADGRVTKKDILDFVANRTSPSHGKFREAAPMTEAVVEDKVSVPSENLTRTAASAPSQPPVSPSLSGGDEIIEMDRMRKMIAERMVDSKRIAPHVTSFVEADVTNVVAWRNKVKHEFQKREGDPLTFTPVFVEAVALAIRDYPMINIQVDGDKIIRKRDINIGIAVALPSGNLIVPVIRNADQLNIGGLAKVVNDLVKRARNNKLKADDLAGGTFTISNVGTFGNVMGTPIIMQPQVGIIAIGAIQKKPAVIETSQGDAIAIRHKMFLSHSYDHRVVDGALGGSVVRRVADYLEKFDTTRTI